MAGTKSIRIEPERLTSTAGNVEAAAGRYQQAYTRLFSEVDTMQAAWDGADNQAFANQVRGFKEDLQRMKTLMDEYAQFLRQSATAYTNTQNHVIEQAKRLVN